MTRVCLAPMDGVTDCAYRIISQELFSAHGNACDELMLWTEFMSAEGYAHNPSGVIKHLLHCQDVEPQCIAQIFGGEAEALKACALDIQEKYNFSGVELNMGCPSPKIMKCAAGSGMLKDKSRTLGIIADISSSLRIPFSLKTRIGLTQDDIQEQFDFLVEASAYVGLIAVHGRTYKQSHSGTVDRDFLYELKRACSDTIIIGNGGLRTYEDMIHKLTDPHDGSTTLDGNMIAQSAIGNPRVLTPHTPNIQQRFDTILRHLQLSVACEIWFERALSSYDHEAGLSQPSRIDLVSIMQNLDGLIPKLDRSPYSPVEFRKYLFNYISGLTGNKHIKKKIPRIKEYGGLRDMLVGYRDDLLNNREIT